jgi:thiamine biosynthesis lipoprotein
MKTYRSQSTIPDVSRRRFTKALGFAAAGLALPARSLFASMLRDNRLELVRHSTFVMGQIANVSVLHHDVPHARQAITAVFDEFRRLESLMSVFDAGSELSRVNAAAGREAVAVSPDTLAVISGAVDAAKRSRGALDITINPLERLWGFRDLTRSARPSDVEVERALQAVGIEHLKIEGASVGLAKGGMSLDLGGVAVGFALDRAAAILKREGIGSALIELSGDYYALGAPAESSRGWEIGIVDPRREGAILRSVHITNQALSTSGNYANTVVFNAKSYGHIFDPADGFPSERLLSATVIAPTGFEADAYSTALFVSGDRSMLPEGSRGIVLRG